MLLEKGVDVNTLGQLGDALQPAPSRKHKEIVWDLLEHGAESRSALGHLVLQGTSYSSPGDQMTIRSGQCRLRSSA